MISRKINSPGIEINEIDRSQYNKLQDYSFPNSPVCLITGFADKGENYKPQWINTKSSFIEQFGYPTNEVETYFFNAAMEILNKNSTLLTYKLPYYNKAKDKYTYTEYILSNVKHIIPEDVKIEFQFEFKIINDIKNALCIILDYFNINYNKSSINSINSIYNWCNDLINKFNLPLSNEHIQTINDLIKRLNNIVAVLNVKVTKYLDIYKNDETLDTYIDISTNTVSKLLSIKDYDDFITYKKSSLFNSEQSGKITIINKLGNKYQKIDTIKEECLGIVPVIVTAANALYFQKLLQKTGNSIIQKFDYNVLTGITDRKLNNKEEMSKEQNNIKTFTSYTDIFDETEYDNSWSKTLAQYFPTILHANDKSFDKTNLKKIGIVVLKAYKDTTCNLINFEILESFIGSLDKTSKNQTTNASEFIDNIVNSQSEYINVFTQIKDENIFNKISFFGIDNQVATSLGFYNDEYKKPISYKDSIIDPLNKLFGMLNNTATSNIDIIVDAGVSNIAQYLSYKTEITDEDDNKSFSNFDNLNIDLANIPSNWLNVIYKFDNFCKNIRKDCIFIADAPRPLCLDGNQKIVRYSKPENTIENSILPKIKYLTNVNSSYSIGYSDWFYCKDEYTGDFFWCPPSIKAVGVYCYTDIYFHIWDAPAGNKRGIITNAYDVAFSPNSDEAGRIYQNCWNYAVNYPINGIVLEGQKTFQKQSTALDRINVRRLMLYLEKQTVRIARNFLYEGNTPYLRQKLVDTLIPLYDDVKNGNGISEYIIKCDESNNTPTTIDRNELHITIAVRPIKTIEFIVINFITTNQSANISEEVKRI